MFAMNFVERIRSSAKGKNPNLISKLLLCFLWVPKLPKFPQYFFFWASNIQYILILQWAQLASNLSNNKDGLSKAVLKVCKVFLLKDLVAPGENPLLICAYVYFFVLIAMITTICWKLKWNNAFSQTERRFVFLVSQFHLSLGFWNINALLFDSFIASRLFQSNIFGIPLDSIIMVVINAILLVLNYVLAFFMSFYSYDPFKDSNCLSMHTPAFQVLTFICKGVMAGLILSDMQIEAYVWVFTFFGFAISTIRYINFIQILPYYEFEPTNLSLMFNSTSVVVSGMSCFLLIINNFVSLSGKALLFAQSFIIIFFIKYNKIFLQKSIHRLLSLEDRNLMSEDIMLKKIFALNYLIKNTKVSLNETQDYHINNLIFWSIWPHYHGNTYSNETLNGGTNKPLYDKIIEKKVYQFLRRVVQHSSSKTKIKIFLANYVIQQNINIIVGYNYLQQILKKNHPGQIVALRLFEIYQEKVHDSLEDILDVKSFLDFESISNRFIGMVHSNSVRYVDFWKSYNNPSFGMMDLLRQSDRIEKADTIIRDYWANFRQKDLFYSSSLRLIYSFYLSLVRNALHSSAKIHESTKFHDYEKKQIEKKNGPLTVDTIPSPNNIVFFVSMSKDSIGKILDLSSNVSEELGWQKKDLTRQSINAVLPRFMREGHAHILIEKLEKEDQDTRLNRNIETFVNDESGNILPCYVYVCLSPNLQEELIYLAILRVQDSEKEQIILAQDGSVQGFTKYIGKKLGLSLDMKSNIKDFCINSDKLTFLNERSKNLKTKKMLKDYVSNENNVDLKDKEEVILSLKINGQILSYHVCKSSYVYIGEVYYVLSFNLKDGHSKNNFRTVKSTEDLEEDERRRGSKEEKFFHHLDRHEESNNPSEISIRGKELNLISLPVSPHTENDHLLHSPLVGEFHQNVQPANYQQSKKKQEFPRKSTKKAPIPKRNRNSNDERNSVSSYNLRVSNTALKLEQALYYIPKDKKMRALNILFVILMVLIVGILLFFQNKNSQVMQNVTGNVLIVGGSVTRLIRMVNLASMCTFYPLLDSQSIFDNRMAFLGFRSLRVISTLTIAAAGTDLINSNTKVRDLASNLEQSLNQRLFTKFPVRDYDESGSPISGRLMNSFELIVEFKAAIQKVFSKPASQIKGNDTKLRFIIDNSFDQLLISCEEGISIIVEDTQIKLRNLDSLETSFSSTIGVFSIFLLLLSLNIARTFIRDRNKMFEVFRRLDEKEIEAHLSSVQKFHSLLLKYDMDIKRLSLVMDREYLEIETFSARQSQLRREKQANMKGINFQIIKTLIFITLLTLFVFSGYIATVMIINAQNNIISRKVNLMVEGNFGLYYTYLRHVAINIYVFGDGNATLRSRPFTEEYDRLSAYLSHMDSVYLSLIDKNTGFGEDDQLVQLLTGNLCALTPSSFAILVGNPCFKLLGGLPSKGIIAVVSYFRNLNEAMKRSFDNSNKTHDDVVTVLNNKEFIEAQGIVPGYLLGAFEMANARMQDQLSKDASRFADSIRNLVVIFVMIYLTVVMPVWWKISKSFEEERAKWRKILRLVPESSIRSNKMLEAYIFSPLKKINAESFL